MKLLGFSLGMSCLFFATSLKAQIKISPGAEGAIITYATLSNGKPARGAKTIVTVVKGKAAIRSSRGGNSRESQWIDYNTKTVYQVLELDQGERFAWARPFAGFNQPELLNGTETVAGIPCKKAKFNINSNTVEVWYNDQYKIKATPNFTVGADLGLIVKMVRNGNYEQQIVSINTTSVNADSLSWPKSFGSIVDEPTYMERLISSRYKTIDIFKEEQVSWGNKINNPEGEVMNQTYHFAGGTVIAKKVHLPEIKNGTSLFAKLTQHSNGDAYDRTGSVFVIPMDHSQDFLQALEKGIQHIPSFKGRNGKTYQGMIATENYSPVLELMRFFTPFGVKHFNDRVKIKGYHWADSAVYKQEITELAPALQGDVWICVFIGNYDKGGHTVSLELNYYPGWGDGDASKKYWLQPIFNTTNVMEMAGQEYGTLFDRDSLTVTVDIPEGLKNISLRYITTGHGGWGGGDEFNPKENQIFVDGERVYRFVPWREDCATYRTLNPVSGNFGNGLSSSDLSRSNWCPGTLTLPVTIYLHDLQPGKHTFKVAIPLGKPEGTSFSAWNVSGVLKGEFTNAAGDTK
ncbi:PNGase F N-terminal domain-containing protein [Chitinophaga caeni]|nr:PNGase F N-terminal domain-containing protein [Chitinophaga caeni]